MIENGEPKKIDKAFQKIFCIFKKAIDKMKRM